MRDPFIFAKNYFKDTPIKILELGVMQGDNAQEFLDYLNPAKAWLIDPWIPCSTYGSSEYPEWDSRLWEKTYKDVVERFKNYPNVEIIRSFGQDIIGQIPDDLDQVYIDAAHDYENVKRDIDIWFHKVRQGGIFSGDDFSSPGVTKAVTEFQAEHQNLAVMVSANKTQWWVVKDPKFVFHSALMKEI